MKIPCINCITLPICKNGNVQPKHSGTAMSAYIGTLEHKCCLLNNYVYGNKAVGSGTAYFEVLDFFKKIMWGY